MGGRLQSTGASMPGSTAPRVASLTARTSLSRSITSTSPANTRLDTWPTRTLPSSFPPAPHTPQNTHHVSMRHAPCAVLPTIS